MELFHIDSKKSMRNLLEMIVLLRVEMVRLLKLRWFKQVRPQNNLNPLISNCLKRNLVLNYESKMFRNLLRR